MSMLSVSILSTFSTGKHTALRSREFSLEDANRSGEEDGERVRR